MRTLAMKQSLDGLIELNRVHMFVSIQVCGNDRRHSSTEIYFGVSSPSHFLLRDHRHASDNGSFEVARNRQFVNIYHI